jgi:hypothetical protein
LLGINPPNVMESGIHILLSVPKWYGYPETNKENDEAM